MYKLIMELFIENDWLGSIGNPTIIDSVSEIVRQYNSIFNTNDATEVSEISESIVTAIFSQLQFTKIISIRNE